MPGDRRHQQAGRQHGPRRGAGRVDLGPAPPQQDQRADEHGQAQERADRGRQPEPHREARQRRVVGGVGHRLGEPDPQPLQTARGPRDEDAEQRRTRCGAEPGDRRAPPAHRWGQEQQRRQRRLERHGHAEADGREHRVPTPFRDPPGHEPDQQEPVDLPQQQGAVQGRRREHHEHDGRGHEGTQPQLTGHHQHRADHQGRREQGEEAVRGQRVEQGERCEQHGQQRRVEVPQLGRGVVDVAALHERDGRRPEGVEVGVQLVHVRRGQQRDQPRWEGDLQRDGDAEADEHEQPRGQVPPGKAATAGTDRVDDGHDRPR